MYYDLNIFYLQEERQERSRIFSNQNLEVSGLLTNYIVIVFSITL